MPSINQHATLIAFIALIVAIVVLSLFGVKDLAVITGLVGVLGTFKPRGDVAATNVEKTDSVNVGSGQ